MFDCAKRNRSAIYTGCMWSITYRHPHECEVGQVMVLKASTDLKGKSRHTATTQETKYPRTSE